MTLIPTPSDYKPGVLDGVWVRTTRRSWWQALYDDGHMVSEWQTLADPKDTGSSRWEERDPRGLKTLILLCPSGKAYRLRSAEDHKLFQMKLAFFTPGIGQQTDAHIIGVVTNTEGDCVCFAWEVQEGRAVKFEDNVLNMRYRAIGPLGLENLGLRF